MTWLRTSARPRRSALLLALLCLPAALVVVAVRVAAVYAIVALRPLTVCVIWSVKIRPDCGSMVVACVLVSAIYELGVEPTFASTTTDDAEVTLY